MLPCEIMELSEKAEENLPRVQRSSREKLIKVYLGYVKGWLCKKERLGKIIPGLEM